MITELAATGDILRDLREDSGRLTSLEKQSASTNGAVMRMEEMMMRLLTGLPPPSKTTRMEEIENEIETMRLTQDATRTEISERQFSGKSTSKNV
jgi:hypothetical protein